MTERKKFHPGILSMQAGYANHISIQQTHFTRPSFKMYGGIERRWFQCSIKSLHLRETNAFYELGYLSPVHSTEILFGGIHFIHCSFGSFFQSTQVPPSCSDGIRHSKPSYIYHEQKGHKYPDMHHEYRIIKFSEWRYWRWSKKENMSRNCISTMEITGKFIRATCNHKQDIP